MRNGSSPSLADAIELFSQIGKHPVFLHINAKEKGPTWPGWNKTTYAQMLEADYQLLLCSKPNTGVLLGEPSENLCTIDCDTDAFLEAYLEFAPVFKTTLLTRGEHGGQLWLYVTGDRPRSVQSLKAHRDSPLAIGAKKPLDKNGDPLEYVQIGEFRCDGGQSVIRGIHPCERYYVWLQPFPPITIGFDQIPWLNDIVIPWGKNRRATMTEKGQGAVKQQSDAYKELLQRAIAALSIDFLWTHFGFEPRCGNPVHSPFRTTNPSNRPSFSVYDEGRRFKDHDTDYPEYRGDSYDFYQFATGKDSRTAFEDFLTLAGLGAELCKNQPKVDHGPFAGVNEELLDEKPTAPIAASVSRPTVQPADPERIKILLPRLGRNERNFSKETGSIIGPLEVAFIHEDCVVEVFDEPIPEDEKDQLDRNKLARGGLKFRSFTGARTKGWIEQFLTTGHMVKVLDDNGKPQKDAKGKVLWVFKEQRMSKAERTLLPGF